MMSSDTEAAALRVIITLQPQPVSSLGHHHCAGQCSVITQDITAAGRMSLWQSDLGLYHN